MIVRNAEDKLVLQEGGKILKSILLTLQKKTKAGIATQEIDAWAEAMICEAGGTPSFKNYRAWGAKSKYPASVCVSVNDEVVHAIPSGRVIKKGDMVSIDIGMKYGGLFTDTALTFAVGDVSKKAKHLIKVTEKALLVGIKKARAGATTGDIGYVIQKYVEAEGFGVVRELVGHGVGLKVHEEPDIPNWGNPGTGILIEEGMVLALEPMVTEGSPDVKIDADGWTWRTRDGKLSAHFEHTILVTKKDAKILT